MKTYPQIERLRFILGDQLNENHSWFQEPNSRTLYLMAEMRQETDYVVHHAQKVLGIFAAMRLFAERLRSKGHQVHYLRISDPENKHSPALNLRYGQETTGAECVEYLEPDEYRLDQEFGAAAQNYGWKMKSSEHFLTERTTLKEMFQGKKTYLMERFYRQMRLSHRVLMQNELPLGGQWNFDAQNRKPYKGTPALPPLNDSKHNLIPLWAEIEQAGIQTLGESCADSFPWPITRTEALELLQLFIQHRLPWFGDFQDAMNTSEPFLWHSRLSFALNLKLISPLEVIRAVEAAHLSRPETFPLHGVEGFIRQILGWREYMRGIYWAEMPDFALKNYFDHQRALPTWFWTGNTKMQCLSQAIGQSLQHGYAHHIQRLMVTGAFALMAGIHPDEIDRWYLGIYIDAFEWVEITNTRGMSQYADGGIVGTKPYLGSAAYIHKMSNYCGSCHYKRQEKLGDDACPLNSLYWHFYHRHRDRLRSNPRIGMMYPTWDRMGVEQQTGILAQAERNLDRLEDL
jgi:deoxyribodipyrimidine photolyase-related protein